MKYCFHVKKLPFDITSRTLSNFFKVPLYDILLKPGNQWIAASSSNGGCLLSEAWIKYTDKQIDNEKPSTSVIYRGEAINIEINRIQEPYENYELCPYFQKGSCSRLSSECYSKHILCDQPYNCDTSNCLYGHRRNPPIASNNKGKSTVFPRIFIVECSLYSSPQEKVSPSHYKYSSRYKQTCIKSILRL